jgi:RNA polymerase sigma-E/F/G factor
MITRTDEEVDRLVERNTGLVGTLVRRTVSFAFRLPGGYEREDLHSLGNLGLLRAAQTFDPEQGVAFSTYAYRCIKNAIVGTLSRETDRQIDYLSLSLPIGEAEDSPLEDQIADAEADTTRSALQGCERALLESAIEQLPQRQAAVIQALYFAGDSVAEVSVRWRLSPQAVQAQHRRALKRLRWRLGRLGFRLPEW